MHLSVIILILVTAFLLSPKETAAQTSCSGINYTLSPSNPGPNQTVTVNIKRTNATSCANTWDYVGLLLDGVPQGIALCHADGTNCNRGYHSFINSGAAGPHTLKFTVQNGSCSCNTTTYTVGVPTPTVTIRPTRTPTPSGSPIPTDTPQPQISPTPTTTRIPLGRTYYLHTDHLGSVMAVTDEKGNVVEHRNYEPYGKQSPEVSSQLSVERGYTGQIKDEATGLSYYNARYYDPTLSRFISADSANDLANRYSYVGGNPVMVSDPSGTMMWAGDGGGGGAMRTPYTPKFNLPATPLGSTQTYNTTRCLGVGCSSGGSVAPGWANDVSDITQGFMQAGAGMLMGPGEAMGRDWNLFWNTPGGVLEKAFLAADFAMMGGLWGYGEYNAANPNATFGERMVAAAPLGIQTALMVGPKVVPAISRGMRNIYWQSQFSKSIAAVEKSGVPVYRLRNESYGQVEEALFRGVKGKSTAFYLPEERLGFKAGIYMDMSTTRNPLVRLQDLLHEHTHHLTYNALPEPYSVNPGLHEYYSFLAEASAPYLSSQMTSYPRFIATMLDRGVSFNLLMTPGARIIP